MNTAFPNRSVMHVNINGAKKKLEIGEKPNDLLVTFFISSKRRHVMPYRKSLLALSIISSLCVSGTTFAQDTGASTKGAASTTTAQKSKAKELATVTVSAGLAQSIVDSLNQKRDSSQITDVITAEDTGKFPDLNVAESLQRVPGVTLERNYTGDGDSINLRGLGPQFTVVEINGMTGVSSGTDSNFGLSNGSRGFNFEILPSELLKNATIYKTSSASLTEGGMAGVVQLETPKPFDYSGFKSEVSASGNHSSKGGQWDPRGSFLVSKNWHDEFGLLASLAYADTTYRADSVQGGSYRPFSAVNTGVPATGSILNDEIANGPRYIAYDDHRKTLGSTLAMQWKPSQKFELTADAVLGSLKSHRNITRDDAALESGLNPPLSATVSNGLITSGQFTGVQQRVGTNYLTTNESLGQYTLHADWRPNESWSIRPFIGYAKRDAKRTWDLYSFRLAQNGQFDPGVVSYNIRGNYLDFGSTATDFSTNPQDFLMNVFILRPQEDKDTARTAKVDLERFFSAESALSSIQFGVRAEDDKRTTIQSQQRLNRTAGTAITVPPGLGSVFTRVNFNVPGSTAPSQLLEVDPSKVASVFYPGGVAVNGTAISNLTGYAAEASYAIEEKTLDGYVQANFEMGAARGNVGLRVVHSKEIATGSSVANIFLPTQVISPVSATDTYNMYLPSANLRYKLTEDLLLRAAYSQTITRPDLNQLAPSVTVRGIDQSGGTGTTGNPYLKPYKANNYDLGAEWYFSSDGLLSATAFYKKLGGFIDTTTYTQVETFPRQSDGVLVSGPIIFTKPINAVRGSIKGLELSAQSRFTFLPYEWMKDFGGIFNYTFTQSGASYSQTKDVRNRGLPGLSKNSYNATLYYDNGKLSARLSYAWRGRYLANFTDDFGVPRFRNPYGQLDFSSSYNFTKQLSAQLDILNIQNAKLVDTSTAQYYPYGVTGLDRRVMLGIRYSFD
ncbi:MAG: TonB-dependent receptor [Xanthomonadaceae bacterium]|nr:TonB-dependent receptor [Xanthomonadaceae bacterium]